MDKSFIIPLRGRLGNQLFEYAFARAVQMKYGVPVVMNETPLRQLSIENRLNAFNISPSIEFSVVNPEYSWKQKLALRIYGHFCPHKDMMGRFEHEKRFAHIYTRLGLFLCHDGYLPLPAYLPNGVTYSDGYFQSVRFFQEYKEAILNELTFKNEIKQSCTGWETTINSADFPVCMHIRLGDYVKHPLHGVATIHYYCDALAALRVKCPSARVFVFSDNTDAIKEAFPDEHDFTFVPSDLSDHQTMYLGSLCKGFIISNSSFSWWMQYLSKATDKLVYAPSRWYNVPAPRDIYLKEWNLIEVK